MLMLKDLSMQEDMLATMQQPGTIALLSNNEEAIDQAVDSLCNVYAVKLWSRAAKEFDKIGSVAICVSKHPLSTLQITLLILTLQPYLVTIFTNKIVDNMAHCLIMEWLDCGTLAEEKLISAEEAVTIVGQILHATASLHEQGIVHRRIRPSNIMMVSRDPIICKLGGPASSGKGFPWIALKS